MTKISTSYKVPIQQWINDGTRFSFVGDNLDKTIGVRDERGDHHSHLQHMYSILAIEHRVQFSHLAYTGITSSLNGITALSFLTIPLEVNMQLKQ